MLPENLVNGDDARALPTSPAGVRPIAKTTNILVVDDNSANLQVLSGMLKDRGYKVRPVRNGRLALLAARKDSPDLILLDINMPELNGYEVCQHLKADEALRGIPVIFISALNENLDKVKAFAVGGVDYITKPFQMEELLARVETHLKLRRLQTELEETNARLATAHEGAESQVRERTAELSTANAGLVMEMEARRLAERRLNAQHAATAALAESTSVEAAAPHFLEAVCKSMGWAWAGVWMVDPKAESLGLVQSWEGGSTDVDEFHEACRVKTFSLGEGLPGRVWATGESAWVPDVMQDRLLLLKPTAGRCGLHGAVAFPIMAGSVVLGVMEFFSQRIEPPDEEITRMMAAIGSQIGQFIEKRDAEVALDKEQEFLKAVLENAQDLIVACDPHGVLAFFNRAAREFHGKGGEPLPAEAWAAEFDLYRADGESLMAKEEVPLFRALRGERVRDVEMVIRPKTGGARTVVATAQAITDAAGKLLGAVAVMHDVTERNILETQLRQAQKMEAFGQLAGGVAHDFNNLLTIISGYSELMLASLRPDDRSRWMIQAIHEAGERAAQLTRQLLAFSRKQVVQPQVLDLNAVVAGAEKMLGRLIGEDVKLTTVPAAGLDRVKADPGQVEQVIMNLVVNARDAMPQGGRISIETANVYLDEDYQRSHGGVEPGHYALLTVSDSGCGMTEEVKRHLFEPFFTTKEVGKGTGLGLATVFGIVKQSGGHVGVSSEVGRGTRFEIYLPSAAEVMPTTQTKLVPAPVRSGNETILLVEDEMALRAMTRAALQANGYTPLEAADGADAIRLCERHPGPIHLLVSDVVMPVMSGRVLAERLTAIHPEMRVLFVSGYMDDAVVRHGVLRAEVAFLQKPFSIDALLRKMRAVLDNEIP